jgi:hypothetical protein
VLGALAAYTQAGRAMWDLEKQCYRLRELSREPLPMERLRFQNAREAQATLFLDRDAVHIKTGSDDAEGGVTIQGKVRDGERDKEPWLRLDADERIADAGCTCNFFEQNRLRKGPCEHVLALRLRHARRRRVSPTRAGTA